MICHTMVVAMPSMQKQACGHRDSANLVGLLPVDDISQCGMAATGTTYLPKPEHASACFSTLSKP